MHRSSRAIKPDVLASLREKAAILWTPPIKL